MGNQVNRFYAFGPFIADVSNRRLLRAKEEISLTPKAFELLFALLENAGHRVEKEELERRIWPEAPSGDVNRLPRLVHTVRQALGEVQNSAQYIETLTKGYRFVGEVKVQDDPPPGPDWRNSQPANGSPAIQPKEAWGEWLTSGMWRDLREGLGLIKEGLDAFLDAMTEAWNFLMSGIGDGGNKALRGFRKMWLPLIIVAAIISLVWYLLRKSPMVRQVILLTLPVLVVLEIVRRWKRRPPIRKVRSIAVLPLKNQNCLGPCPDFAQEMTGAIIGQLAKLEFLRICNASDESNLPISDIAKKLRVKAVLQGNVESLSGRIRVNIEIVGWDGVTILWSDSFEETFSDSATPRNTISQQLVDQLLQSMRKKVRMR